MLIGEEFLKKIGATYHQTDRGGDITYHGPGQIVGYPILDLGAMGIGIRSYIDLLEESIIATLKDFGIDAGRLEGAAGVWLSASAVLPQRKICAIGVRSSHSVTMHGFALNVSTQLEYFSYINPCGFVDKGVTSMERELGEKIDVGRVKSVFVSHFEKILSIKIK